MKKTVLLFSAIAVVAAGVALAQEDSAPLPPLPPPSKITGKTPVEVEAAAPKGTLRNPYTGQADKADEGHKLFLSYSCSGCHGGNGGGGMCPQLIPTCLKTDRCPVAAG